MRGRVVIPIHNASSELVAYAGRAIDGSEPKYKLPPGFHKSHVVFNLNRIAPDPAKPVVLVEGFFDCMKVVQAGFPALALMGSSLSERQESLLSRFHSLVLCLDGDEAGRTATEDIVRRLVRKVFIKIIDLPDGVQPDHLSAEELRTLLGA